MTTPRGRAREELSAAVTSRDEARAHFEDADTTLRQAIRDAEAVGVSLVEIAQTTGYHRNTIRAIIAAR